MPSLLQLTRSCVIIIIFSCQAFATLQLGETIIRDRLGDVQIVLDEGDLKRIGDVELSDVLRSVPGFQIVQYGGNGQLTSASIQGDGSERVLVLIDNVRVNDPTSPSGAFDFSTLDMRLVAKIEILFGPQVVKYGADALAGVVLITTKNTLGVNYSVEVGSPSFHRQGVGYGRKDAKQAWSVFAFNKRSDGVSAASARAGNNEADHHAQQGALTKYESLLGQDILMSAMLMHTQSSYSYDAGPGPNADDVNARSVARQTTAGLQVQKNLSTQSKLRSILTHQQNERAQANPVDQLQPSYFLSSQYSSTFNELKNEFSYQGEGSFLLQLGLDLSAERATIRSTDTYLNTDLDKNRSFSALFARSEAKILPYSFLHLGYRQDQDLNQYEIGVKYEINPLLDHGLRFSAGGKRPSLYQLYSPFGDSNLKEEHLSSYQYEVNYDHILYGRHQLIIFSNNYTNLIDFSGGRYTNFQKVQTQGVQGRSIIFLQDKDRVEYSWTYLQARDLNTKQNLIRKPQWSESFSWQHQWANRFNHYLMFRSLGQREDNTNSGKTTLPAVGLFDIKLSWQFHQETDISFKINNIFDQIYEEAWGYSGITRSYFLSIQSTL